MGAKKIVIIGGVAGGATAAARARRVDEHCDITMIEKGSYVSFANCGLPYFISGDIKSRNKLLLQTPEGFYERYKVKVLTETEATSIDRNTKTVLIKHNGKNSQVQYDKLILSQGANPIKPPVTGLPDDMGFSLRDIRDMDDIDNYIKNKNPKKAVIIGAGFIGIEMAEALHKRGLHVSIVEKSPQVLPFLDAEFSEMARRDLISHKIDVYTNLAATSFDSAAKSLVLENGSKIETEMVIFSVGVRPEILLAKEAGLKIGESGAISVNNQLQSSDPDIYVVGDMAEITNILTGKKVRIPLAGPANRQGRIAASNALGERKTYKGALGTSIVKVMDKTVGSTGLSERQAKQAGLSYDSVTIHPNHHAGYYPGAKGLTLKIIFLKGSGKLIGGQCFGEDGVDKRLDVIATAIAGNMTVEDLEELDLAYAPPYSSANDPINVAGFVAANSNNGFSPSVKVSDLIEVLGKQDEYFILDVRNTDEYAKGGLKEAVNIPLPVLRNRLNEIPKDKKIYVHCQAGMRAHLALRILAQNGFRHVYNVTGGYKSIELELRPS